MQATPRGLRLHIGLFGRRNVGKSSLLNALVRQQVAIVSEVAGTTTDPVEKPMELLPLGPVVFIDTADVDDEGHRRALRIEKTRRILDRTDWPVVAADDGWGPFEDELVAELTCRGTPSSPSGTRPTWPPCRLRCPGASFLRGPRSPPPARASTPWAAN
ncbi:MAG: 50S ribosome-binding GTPase [bacterium]|nr:50S ribosome-binding GTPase [bacterium]